MRLHENCSLCRPCIAHMNSTGAQISGAMNLAFGTFLVGILGGIYGTFAGILLGFPYGWDIVGFFLAGWAVSFVIVLTLEVRHPEKRLEPDYVRDGVLLGLLISSAWQHLLRAFRVKGTGSGISAVIGVV